MHMTYIIRTLKELGQITFSLSLSLLLLDSVLQASVTFQLVLWSISRRSITSMYERRNRYVQSLMDNNFPKKENEFYGSLNSSIMMTAIFFCYTQKQLHLISRFVVLSKMVISICGSSQIAFQGHNCPFHSPLSFQKYH